MKEALKIFAAAVALAALIALCGCSIAMETRYPWDRKSGDVRVTNPAPTPIPTAYPTPPPAATPTPGGAK